MSKGRYAPILLLILLPIASGGECFRLPVNSDFEQLAYVSPRGCSLRDFPGYIGITNLGNGQYMLEIAEEVVIAGGDTGDAASCEAAGGFFVGSCFRKLDSVTRPLSFFEMQRVNDVFGSLENETTFFSCEGWPFPSFRCQIELIGVNDRTYPDNRCPEVSELNSLTEESNDRVYELWESFRSDFP